jgi:hypothetical protein
MFEDVKDIVKGIRSFGSRRILIYKNFTFDIAKDANNTEK